MIHLHKHHEMDWQTWLAIILYGVKGQPWQSIVGLQDISEKEKKKPTDYLVRFWIYSWYLNVETTCIQIGFRICIFSVSFEQSVRNLSQTQYCPKSFSNTIFMWIDEEEIYTNSYRNTSGVRLESSGWEFLWWVYENSSCLEELWIWRAAWRKRQEKVSLKSFLT